VRSRDVTMAVLLALASSAWSRLCRADEDLDALLSEPVESTAGKSSGSAAEAPALSLSITAEDLRRHGIRTLAEAYNYLTLGLVSEDPLGEPAVGGRGLMFTSDGNRHILLLIDGHTTNDQENGSSQHGRALGLPIELIDHIEVVLGPGAVLYGANAMLGVVNVVTKRAKTYSGLHVIAEAEGSPPLDRAHDIIAPAATTQYLRDVGRAYRFGLGDGRVLELRGKPVELTGQVEYYSMKGPALQWGPQIETGTNFGRDQPLGVWGGTTRKSYYSQIASGYSRLVAGSFEATIHLAASRISQPHLGRNQGRDVDFDDPDGATERRAAGLDLKWRHDLSAVAAMQLRLYGDVTSDTSRSHDHPYVGCVNTISVPLCERGESGFGQSIGSELQGTFDWMGTGTMSTTVGGDARIRRVGFQNGVKDLDAGTELRFNDIHRSGALGAIYVQQVFRPARFLTVNAGARWDTDSDVGSRLVPRAAVIGEPWAGGSVKAIYSEAFRAPSVDELSFRNADSAIQAQGLKPESVRSLEAVLQERFGTQRLVFGVFQSWWTDPIVRPELHVLPFQTIGFEDEAERLITAAKRSGQLRSGVQFASQYQNVPSIENFGLNAAYDGTLANGRLAYGFNVTASYARLNTIDGPRRVTLSPTTFGNARASYDLSGSALKSVALAAHFSGRRLSEVGEDEGFKPLPFAPAALDLRATLVGAVPAVRGLSYRLMGLYAFDASSPYIAGPNSLNVLFAPSPELVPTVRFTLMLGLEYSLDSLR
jgi:outer membrane receptor for ferrienterochelin and colicins